jgi:hypothetical protein
MGQKGEAASRSQRAARLDREIVLNHVDNAQQGDIEVRSVERISKNGHGASPQHLEVEAAEIGTHDVRTALMEVAKDSDGVAEPAFHVVNGEGSTLSL